MKKIIKFFIKSILLKANIIASIITSSAIFALFIGFDEIVQSLSSRIIICVIIYLFTLCISCIWVFIENNNIIVKFNNTSIQVKYGDLFAESGITVIPVDTTFSTLVNDKVISSNSLHGKFIKTFFGGNIGELQEQIIKGLAEYNLYSPINKDITKWKEKYEIGTIVEVNKEGHKFFLLALTELNDSNKAECNFSQYDTAIKSLYKYMDTHSQGDVVNISLLGSGFARLSTSKKNILLFMILQAMLSEYSFYGGMRIILHKSVKNEIILSEIKNLLK